MTPPLHPPKSWFDHPGDIPTDRRITITAEGRVYGYIALRDVCHVGMPGCVKPPMESPSNFEFAHQGETMTAEGDIISTANIGGGAGHADMGANVAQAAEFYANTQTQLMRVRYGVDDEGLWFSGALWPDVDELTIEHIRASPISGDWRFLGQWRKSAAGHEFAGAALVNIPGYHMKNAGDVASANGVPEAIAAAAAMDEKHTPPQGVRAAAKRGLKWHEEGYSGSGLRPATVREAKSLAAGTAQTLDKVKRMNAWFARHESDRSAANREGDKPTPGEVAWELWGGDAGRSWSGKIMERVNTASVLQDANGNLLTTYSDNDATGEGAMSCNCENATEKNQSDGSCPCGAVPAPECQCDGRNVTAEATPVDEAPAEGDAPVEQPKLANETSNDVLSSLSGSVEEMGTRLANLEDMIIQMYGEKLIAKLEE
jgi:hypothetical protein